MTTTAIASPSSCCYCSSSFCSYKFNRRISTNKVSVVLESKSSSIIHHHNPFSSLIGGGGPRQLFVSCQVAIESAEELSKEEDEEMNRAQDKIGSRVKVKVPLKVYHVPKIPELDLTGMEGELKQYVGLWKGNRISANFPFKIQFFTQVQGRGPVKFFAHLKEDEFDYIDQDSPQL